MVKRCAHASRSDTRGRPPSVAGVPFSWRLPHVPSDACFLTRARTLHVTFYESAHACSSSSYTPLHPVAPRGRARVSLPKFAHMRAW